MKFRICWTESHNPYNWGDTYEEGRKNILNNFPNATISEFWTAFNNDHWLDLDCWETFEANSIEEAKKYVEENYEAEVFDVWQEPNYTDPVFTEEDLVWV